MVLKENKNNPNLSRMKSTFPEKNLLRVTPSVALTAACVDAARVLRKAPSSLRPRGHVVLFSDVPKASRARGEQSF